MSRLVSAAAAASGARVVLDATVRELSRTAAGRWQLIFGPVPSPQVDEVDAVILAVPAAPAARLLGSSFGLDYASVALAGFAFGDVDLPDMSGFLVPPGEGTLVKAATFFTTKWPHLAASAGGPVIVRVSLGRAGEEDRLQLDDASLLAVAHRELSDLIGVALPAPVDSWVQRWGGGLPQYAPGHADRVTGLRATLPAGIAVAGAAFDGVGIPVCVASGERAADDVSKFLKETV
ncbi:MAG TPA: FAD-dependent oxidoreductase, partial [Actinoplanes sp.]|nr:FAD-dependent oxidoreductase [Actinoplanes sp.]